MNLKLVSRSVTGRVARAATCAAVLALGLSGCLIPERFQATVTVKQDGSYNFKYDGTASHALAVAQSREKGGLSAKDEASLARAAEKDAKSPGVRKMKYLGGGRFELAIDRDEQPNKLTSTTLNLVQVTREKDGVMIVAASPLKKKDADELKAFGITMEGSVDVILPPGATVLSHNAADTPGLFSKAYRWKIGKIDEKPTIKFKLGA